MSFYSLLLLPDQAICVLIILVGALHRLGMPMRVRPIVDSQGFFNFILEQAAHLEIVWQMLLPPLLVIPLPIQHVPAQRGLL